MTVGEMFDKPDGRVFLHNRGHWWLDRTHLGLDAGGMLTVMVADGRSVATLTGTPEQMRNLAAGLIAQAESAEVNTGEPQPWKVGSGCEPSASQARDILDAGRPGR